ncbi:hypothetical protein GGI00_000446 [Coemansia sp. RSA 2681]|nr:hypothetical protein GGI00_000446 [Coemansia sp. RSA 2681]
MANGIAFNPFDAREDVFQECRLSGVIVVVLMELLQCLLLDSKNKKLEGAFLELPSGRMSHVCHGDSLVITLSDDRFLADIKETIDLFCTSTGVYFDFFKTRALYIGRDFSTEPLRACPEFPLVPIADSEPFYYLGAFFGNADVKHYTRDVNVMLLDLLDSAYVISCRHSDHCIRTQALDHFVSPRLQHILEFVPIILHLTVDITDDLAKLVCGHSSRLPDDEYEAALQARTGIYGFVDFKHTRMAVQLGLVHLASSYFQQIRFPDDNGLAVPVWAKLLLQIWQLSIKSDGKNQMPQWPCDIQAGLFVNFFYDPFLQFEPYRHSRFLDNTLPPAWDRLYKALFSNEAQQLHQVHIAEHSMAAPRLQLPFIGTNLWRSTKLDWPLLYGAFKDVPPLCTPITVANLPQFIAQLGMLELKLKGSAHYCQIRKSMYRRFSAHFEDQNKHGAVARVNNKEQIVLKNAGFDVSAISETGIPAKELPQYIERLTTLIAEWKDKNPNRDARDNLVTHFMEIYMGAQEHDAQLTPSARNAPASLHLTYGHLDYAAYSVPFVHWSNLADTRAMLQRLDAEHKLRKDAEAPSPAKIIKPRQRRQRHKPADDASIPKPRKRKERD